jgi:hypothetical protein
MEVRVATMGWHPMVATLTLDGIILPNISPGLTLDVEVFYRGKGVQIGVTNLGDGRKLPIWVSPRPRSAAFALHEIVISKVLDQG